MARVAMTRLRTIIIVVALGIAVAGLIAKDAVTVGIGLRAPERTDAPAQSGFAEIKWPFPRDMWGDGRAFRCAAADCGVEVSLYIRPKIGFCNCDTGVADEAELDRVSDLELFSPKFVGLTRGGDIRVGWMRGLSRIYQVDIPYDRARPIMAMAFNQNCDVMVATVVAPLEHYPSAERHVLAFLNGEPILKWARAQFGI
jgi:hypothetical protein